MEEWLFAEDLMARKVSQDTAYGDGMMSGTDHRSEHASVAPHVQTIIVFLEIYEKFRSFEVAGSHPDVIFCLRVVEFG